MIDALYGEITEIRGSTLIIHTGFIDFEIFVSSLTAEQVSQMGNEDRRDTRIYTYLLHREDSMTLYGFLSERERQLFLEIIKVQGIGPKQAIKILSGITPEQFITALDNGDISVLTSIPGLGTKTAQKMILTLRDKLTLESDMPVQGREKSKLTARKQIVSDIIHALSDMGYDKRDVRDSVEQSLEALQDAEHMDDTKFEKQLFTAALLRLG